MQRQSIKLSIVQGNGRHQKMIPLQASLLIMVTEKVAAAMVEVVEAAAVMVDEMVDATQTVGVDSRVITVAY